MKRIRELRPGDLVENALTNRTGTVVATLDTWCRIRDDGRRIVFWLTAHCLACSQDRYERLQILDLIAHAARRPLRTIGFDEPLVAVRLGYTYPRPGRTIVFVAALWRKYDLKTEDNLLSTCRTVGELIDRVLILRGRQAKKAA